jgi:hypothetical protein
MHRIIGQAHVLLASALFLVACGATQDPAAKGAAAGAEGELCETLSAGPPPVCPESCEWNGTECRKKRGIIVYDAAPTSTSAPTAAPTSAPTSGLAPDQAPPAVR